MAQSDGNTNCAGGTESDAITNAGFVLYGVDGVKDALAAKSHPVAFNWVTTLNLRGLCYFAGSCIFATGRSICCYAALGANASSLDA
jgi:hypothetical protein